MHFDPDDGARSVVRVDDDGLVHRRLGLVGWGEITRLQIVPGPYGRRLIVHVSDLNALLARMHSPVRRWIARFGQRGQQVAFHIYEPMSAVPLEQVRSTIEQRAGRTYPR